MGRRQLWVAGFCGLVAPLVAFVCILVAIGSWSQFSWVNNALSDLGVQPGVTAVVFNSGLVVAGLLFAVFALGLFPLLGKTVIGKVGVATLILACIALVCIGVFNENFRPTHYIVSVMFFITLPISLWFLTGASWLGKHRGLAVFTLAVSLAAAIPWILQLSIHYVSNVAIPEFVSGFAGAMWTVVLSCKMLKEASRSSAA